MCYRVKCAIEMMHLSRDSDRHVEGPTLLTSTLKVQTSN